MRFAGAVKDVEISNIVDETQVMQLSASFQYLHINSRYVVNLPT